MYGGSKKIISNLFLKFLNISEKGVHVALTKDKRPKIPSYAGGRMPLTSELASQVKKLISKKQSLNSYPEQIKDWLVLQSQKSILPMHDKVLIETFPSFSNFLNSRESDMSEPDILYPFFSNTLAMPIIPAPPIPTKWICFTFLKNFIY